MHMQSKATCSKRLDARLIVSSIVVMRVTSPAIPSATNYAHA